MHGKEQQRVWVFGEGDLFGLLLDRARLRLAFPILDIELLSQFTRA